MPAPPTDPSPAAAPRGGLAIIANVHTPYRLHLHRRIAAEIPELQLHSAYTHDAGDSPWTGEPPPEIGPARFGVGQPSAGQPRPRFAWREWRKAGRVIRWMRAHDVRAVVMMGYNDVGRLRVIRWCRRHRVPCFLFGDSNVRGDAPAGAKAVAKRVLVTRVLGWCSGALSCGSLGADYFVKYGVPRERVFYMPYEPDYPLIAAVTDEQVNAARQRLGLDPARRRLVFGGRLVDVKRVDLLIDAFAAIAAGRPEWDLLIVGDGERRDALRVRVPEALRGRVTWAGFVDDPRAVAALYRAGDCLVLPSDVEPWAVVVNEAVAAGLAVVASDAVGAAPELVREGVNGFTFPRGDVAGLTDRLRRVTDPNAIDAMKAASATVLADWRRTGDPVRGLRAALASVGVLPRE